MKYNFNSLNNDELSALEAVALERGSLSRCNTSDEILTSLLKKKLIIMKKRDFVRISDKITSIIPTYDIPNDVFNAFGKWLSPGP